MIGDRLDTDVKFGNCSGMKCSALVLTGCTTVNEIKELIAKDDDNSLEMMPTIMFSHVGYIVEGNS